MKPFYVREKAQRREQRVGGGWGRGTGTVVRGDPRAPPPLPLSDAGNQSRFMGRLLSSFEVPQRRPLFPAERGNDHFLFSFFLVVVVVVGG